MALPTLNFTSPARCYARAEEARKVANEIRDARLWEIMVEVADEYEEMARDLEDAPPEC